MHEKLDLWYIATRVRTEWINASGTGDKSKNMCLRLPRGRLPSCRRDLIIRKRESWILGQIKVALFQIAEMDGTVSTKRTLFFKTMLVLKF